VKEKWGIGVLFLSIAALCYILGQLGFISWVRQHENSNVDQADTGVNPVPLDAAR
jgi:hypothetical protein